MTRQPDPMLDLLEIPTIYFASKSSSSMLSSASKNSGTAAIPAVLWKWINLIIRSNMPRLRLFLCFLAFNKYSINSFISLNCILGCIKVKNHLFGQMFTKCEYKCHPRIDIARDTFGPNSSIWLAQSLFKGPI